MNRIEFGSIWCKHTNLPPNGKPRIAYCQYICFPDRKIADLAIIAVFNYPLCFRWLRFFVVALGLSSWRKDWACDRHCFEAPQPEYAMVWSVPEQ